MHINDIPIAIVKQISSDIEDVFKALIGWPDYDRIEGSSPNHRKELLLLICEELRGNCRQMPGDIAELIREQCEGLEGGTYDDGARAVRGDLSPFLARLGQGSR